MDYTKIANEYVNTDNEQWVTGPDGVRMTLKEFKDMQRSDWD